MSFGSRFADALLGSPIPPPNWRNERFAGSGWKSRRGRRAGRAYYVHPQEIQAALAETRTHTNPPVVQGWAWLLAFALLVAEGAGLLGFRGSRGSAVSLVLVLAPLPLWFAAVTAVAAVSRDVDVRDDAVFVRSWLGEWFGLAGRPIGSVASVRIVRLSESRIRLSGDAGEAIVWLGLWPGSSRDALERRLPDPHDGPSRRRHDARRGA